MEESQTQTGSDFGTKKLPNDGMPLTMGIISVVLLLCCCFPFVGLGAALVSAILGFLGFNNAKKALALYDADPALFDEKSAKNVRAGKTISLIGMILALLVLLGWVGYVITMGGLMDWDEFKQQLDQIQ